MINLEKGQRISMDKGLSLVGVGLGWDPNEGTGYDFDLDASAFMLGSNGKIPTDDYFVFYNNQKSPDNSVESTGDDLTGGNSDGGDDETLNVDLTKVSSQIQEIVFTATIYKAEERKQNFGQVRNSYIRIYDAKITPRLLAMTWMRTFLLRPLLNSVVCIVVEANGNSKQWVSVAKEDYSHS